MYYFRSPLILSTCSVYHDSAPCRIISLPVHGFNPSLVRWNSTHLLGVGRTTSVNIPTLRRCNNSINSTHHFRYRLFSDSSVFEATEDLKITGWRRILKSPCASKYPSVADARLVMHENEILISHRCGPHFVLSRLVSNHVVKATHDQIVLSTPKNGGIFVWRKNLYELTDVVPFRFKPVHSKGSDARTKHAIPSQWAEYVRRPRDIHNSVNPIYIPRLNGYLGMAHWFMKHGKFHISATSMFGYEYLQVLFLFSASTRRITKVSRPFCFPSLHKPSMCDGIQFPMSIVKAANDKLMISYGVNDCNSAVAYMPLTQIERMLEDA